MIIYINKSKVASDASCFRTNMKSLRVKVVDSIGFSQRVGQRCEADINDSIEWIHET